MSLSIHDLTVPVLTRGLGVLSAYLDKAEADATARNFKPPAILDARLYPDMLSFTSQVQRVSDTAKASVARLTGVEAPAFPDTETSFVELKERIAKTLAFIASVPAAAFEGAAERSIEMRYGKASLTLSGRDYVTKFMLPNFYFHLVTAHAILRHNGVAVGKMDFLGSFD
ncbi:MAG: DUF1993 domain-containing protein [Rhodospirillales bacterium]|nr:DUF1993 domain-containing protein [Rhodospirillales bacterium]